MAADPIQELVNRTDQKTLAIWALNCAKRVLPLFESACPNDPRPRDAIEAGHAWVMGEIPVGEARKAAFAAHAAARASSELSAAFAARAAGHAAATAHTPLHAVHAVDYAVQAASLDSKEGERAWQYDHLVSLNQ